MSAVQVTVDGLLTRYQVAGSGQMVLLLHGWGDSLASLSGLQKRLSSAYKVVSLDLPGFGRAQPPQTVWSLDDYAVFVQHFLHGIGAGEPYGVVAHSNGGALAIRALSLGSLKPRKLVLLAAAGIRPKRGVRYILQKVVAKTGDVATLWLPERYRQALRKSLYGMEVGEQPDSQTLKQTLKITTAQDVRSDARHVAIPTLLIYGQDDKAVPLEDGERYHKLIRGSILKLVEGGHYVHHDKPAETAKAIEEFLT